MDFCNYSPSDLKAFQFDVGLRVSFQYLPHITKVEKKIRINYLFINMFFFRFNKIFYDIYKIRRNGLTILTPFDTRV